MKILLVTDTYLPTISGVTTVVSGYRKALQQKKHTVGILAPKIDSRKILEKNFFGVSGIPNFFRSDTILPILPVKLKQKIKKFDPDVIHIHTPGVLGLWARSFAKKNGIKLITTVHGIPNFSTTYLPLGHLYEESIQKRGWKFWKWFLKPSNIIIAPSIFIVEQLKKQNITQRIVRLPFWVDAYNLKKAKSKNKTTFLFFGRLDDDKNLSFLIKSWAKTKTKNKKLIIAGRDLDNQKENLILETKKLNCSDSIEIHGKVSEKKKLELFSKADFFVMPSKVEVQSIVTYQAALSGIPVIVANSGALPEIAKSSSQPHLIFNPNLQKSLISLLDDCNLNKEKYKKAYKLKKSFTKFSEKEYLLSTLISKIYK